MGGEKNKFPVSDFSAMEGLRSGILFSMRSRKIKKVDGGNEVMVRIVNSKVPIWITLTFLCLSLSCDFGGSTDSRPCGGIDLLIVPESPYDSPIWHPSGQFIGFNHIPLKNITYPYGEGCWGEQHFAFDSAGFWLINPEGTNMRRIFPYTLMSPAWSPDGEWIAFVLGAQIFKMRFTGTTFDTTTLVQLTSQGRNFFPAWSPDGQWIAYDRSLPDESGSGGIWRMKSDSTLKQSLFGGAFPAWHPGGNILLGVIGTTPTSFWKRFVRYNLVHGTPIDTLAAIIGNDNRHPHYSLGEIKIAFWSNGNVWLMDTTGINQREITVEGVDAGFGLPFSWSPSSTEIVYTHYDGEWTYDNGVLWIVNLNTREKKQLTFNP